MSVTVCSFFRIPPTGQSRCNWDIDENSIKCHNPNPINDMDSNYYCINECKTQIRFFRMLSLNVGNHGFETWLGQTRDYKFGICCFSSKHDVIRSKSKGWLAPEFAYIVGPDLQNFLRSGYSGSWAGQIVQLFVSRKSLLWCVEK